MGRVEVGYAAEPRLPKNVNAEPPNTDIFAVGSGTWYASNRHHDGFKKYVRKPESSLHGPVLRDSSSLSKR